MFMTGVTVNQQTMFVDPTTQLASPTTTAVAMTPNIATATTTDTDDTLKISSSSEAYRNNESTLIDSKKVQSIVDEYFKDIPLMSEISRCESHYRQYNKDGSLYLGKVNNKDVGAFQINERYHLKASQDLGMDISTLAGNLRYARRLYNEEGAYPWVSSSPCWGKTDTAKAEYGNTFAIK